LSYVRHTAALLLCALWPALPAWADDQVARLLAGDQAPAGVVFEVVEGSDEALAWALPRIASQIRRLRERFPDLDVAVVSHGAEQFALQHRYREEFAAIHAAVDGLIADSGAQVHVCGAHAGWYGVGPEDFIDSVDVAPSGPAQINQYVELGYERIVVQEE
jgi:intracellular sulfur oxidation DsrE/DsrF family protein